MTAVAFFGTLDIQDNINDDWILLLGRWKCEILCRKIAKSSQSFRKVTNEEFHIVTMAYLLDHLSEVNVVEFQIVKD